MKLESNNIRVIERACEHLVYPTGNLADCFSIRQTHVFDSFLLGSELEISNFVNIVNKRVKNEY